MVEVTFAFTMLGSSDLERAIRFYGELLGLKVAGRFGDFVFFETGATKLALTGELAAAASDERSHECVFGVAGVAHAYDALRDRIAFLNEPRPVNAEMWAVNFLDPDGHQCSFYGPR